MNANIFLLAFCSVALSIVALGSDHLEGWTFFEKSQSFYKRFSQEESFDEAEAKCQAIHKGSHLASFSSKEEFVFLNQLACKSDSFTWIGMRHNGTPKDGVEKKEKNRFETWFVDGSANYTFTEEDYGDYWATTGSWEGWEPNGLGESFWRDECVHLSSEYSFLRGKMGDSGCDRFFPFICKVPVSSHNAEFGAPSTTSLATASSSPETTPSSTTEPTTTEEPTAAGGSKCLTEWTLHEASNSCYKKFDEKLTFYEAETNCQKRSPNSHLASFSNATEFDFLRNLNHDSEPYWIGLRHNATPKEDVKFGGEDRFEVTFIDHSKLPDFRDPSYNYYWGYHWSQTTGGLWIDEPSGLEKDGYKEACVQMAKENGYLHRMFDVDCNKKLPYACRMKLQQSETSTTTESSTTTKSSPETTPSSTTEPSTTEEPTTADGTKCLAGWALHESSNSCYKKFDEELSFYEAETNCQKSSAIAHLASFGTQKEFDFIRELNHDSGPYWIGLRHNATPKEDVKFGGENRFEVAFIDHSQLPDFRERYYNYYWGYHWNRTTGVWIDEPSGLEVDGYKEACVQMAIDNGYRHRMSDIDCNKKLPFVCRMKLQQSETSTTTANPTTTSDSDEWILD